MSDGNDRTDSGDDPPDDGVLDPDDLDIRERDEVHERGEGRYVISTEGADRTRGGGPEPTRRDGDPRTGADPDGTADATDHGTDSRRLDVLLGDLEALSAQHALAVAAKTADGTDVMEAASSDPAVPFAAVARWYAERSYPDLDPDRALATLLADAGLSADDD